jgi:hypothetical protein
MEFMQKAVATAENKDFNEEIAALRTYANLLLDSGQPEAGRKEYQKALNIFSRYHGYNQFIQNSTHIWTELSWAIAEANNKFMDQAKQHISQAENYLSALPPSPGKEQLTNQITQAKFRINFGTSQTDSTNGQR